MKATALLSVLVLAIACSGDSDPEPVQQPAAQTPAPPSEPEQPPPLEGTLSVAELEDDKIVRCVDLHFTYGVLEGAEREQAQREIDELRERAGRPNTAEDKLNLPPGVRCEDQFSDRTVFATCRAVLEGPEDPEPNGAPEPTMSTVQFYYDVADVFGSDARMVECMSDIRGQWQAMDRNSPEVQRALRRSRLEDIQRQAQKIQDLAERAR